MSYLNNTDYEPEPEYDEIRAPDPVIKERLIEPIYNNDYNFVSTSDADLDQILKQSLAEFELAETQKVQEMIALERSTIAKKYTDIKQKLQKVQSFDATNKDTYSTIISIIELYEADFVDTYTLDETSYNNVFKILKTVRLTKEEFDLLAALIV
jgi:hypothetical protein